MPVVHDKPTKRISRRLQRLSWTATALVVLAAIAAVVTSRIRKDNQPDEYVPGEELRRDITNVSADKGAKALPEAPASAHAVKAAVTGRNVIAFSIPARNLPPGLRSHFTDVTKEAGLEGFRQFQGARSSQLPEDMGSGVAWGDFDNDGLEDLFVVSGGGPLNAPPSKLAASAPLSQSG